jgi:probable F420-dependent oxidoreductase
MTPSPDNHELMRRWGRAWASRDFEAFASLVHDDVVLWPPPGWPEGGPIEGREAFVAQMRRLTEDFTEQTSEVLDSQTIGGWQVSRWTWHTRGRTSGIATSRGFAGAWRFSGGKLAEVRFFNDFEDAIVSIGSDGAISRLGLLLELPTQRENVELALRAERAGFESAWAPEFHNHSGVLALAGAALVTERIQLGTAIAWAFGRSPLLTAVTALDLDEMSNGRFNLGLGTGTKRMRTDWLGAPAERPARRVRETIEAVRAVFESPEAGALDYDGDLVSLRVRPYGRAGQARTDIPIYLAAVNELMARTAGEVADGVVAHPMASTRYIDELMRPAIEAGALAEERDPADVQLADWVIVAISADAEQARRDAARQIAFHATVRTYDGVLALHGFTEQAMEIRELWKKFDLAGMTELVSDDLIDAMSVAGTPEQCRQKLAQRAQSADLLLLGAPVVATDPDALRDYHSAIVETFGSRAGLALNSTD